MSAGAASASRRQHAPWVPGERLVGGGPAPQADPSAPLIGVVAVQGDVLEHLRALRDVGARAVAVKRPEDLDGVDGLIVPGGESTTIGRLLELFGLLEPIRALVASGTPTFGTCAGLILLSDRLEQDRPQTVIGGLDVTTRRNAFGRQVDSFEADLDVAGIDGGPLHAVFIRAPWVERAGQRVEVLASAAGRIVAVRQGPLLATSFHPELTDDTRVHGLFADIVRAADWRDGQQDKETA